MKKEKYSVTIKNLKNVIETHIVELFDAINVTDYILIENRLIWITEVENYYNLVGIEQAESLEECRFSINENSIKN